MQLFDIASRHRAWLAQSQSFVAANISNANTPGFAARHTQEFSEVLQAASSRPVTTNPAHISVSAALTQPVDDTSDGSPATHSGNTVDVDGELIRAGEIRGGYALNASVTKAFQRMLQASTRS